TSMHTHKHTHTHASMHTQTHAHTHTHTDTHTHTHTQAHIYSSKSLDRSSLDNFWERGILMGCGHGEMLTFTGPERERECVHVCDRERERERERGMSSHSHGCGLTNPAFVSSLQGAFKTFHFSSSDIDSMCF